MNTNTVKTYVLFLVSMIVLSCSDSGSESIPPDEAGLIVAVDDDFSNSPISISGGIVGNVLNNDLLDNQIVSANAVNLSIVSDVGLNGVTISSNGQLEIGSGNNSGEFTIVYSICEVSFPNNCSNGNVSVSLINDFQGVVTRQDTNTTEFVEYTYDTEGRILTWSGLQENGGDFEFVYSYDQNGNPTSRYMEVVGGSNPFIFTQTFVYDSEGRLIQFNDDHFFNYISNNQVEVTIGTVDYVYDLDDNERVTKVANQWGYDTFQYDENGNLTRAESFDDNGQYYDGYTFSYDDTPNPFYGQLSQLEILFARGQVGLLNNAGWDYRGYTYPYNPNNVKEIRQDGASDFNTIFHLYEYNDYNYPTQVTRNLGNTTFTYSLTYSD